MGVVEVECYFEGEGEGWVGGNEGAYCAVEAEGVCWWFV